MESMFNGCSSLLEINFTMFNTESITNLDNLLYGCSSLKVINLSGINLMNVNSAENIFEGINNLGYINIKDATIPTTVKTSLINKFNNRDNLIVCQNQDKVLDSTNIKDICCDYDLNAGKCISSNYIVITFQNSLTYNLKEGFDLNFFILDGSLKLKGEEINIASNSRLEIHLSSPPQNLENFFCPTEDLQNSVISVDLSNLDPSRLNSMDEMFSECKNLKIANLSGLNANSASSMIKSFYNCQSLQILAWIMSISLEL